MYGTSFRVAYNIVEALCLIVYMVTRASGYTTRIASSIIYLSVNVPYTLINTYYILLYLHSYLDRMSSWSGSIDSCVVVGTQACHKGMESVGVGVNYMDWLWRVWE